MLMRLISALQTALLTHRSSTTACSVTPLCLELSTPEHVLSCKVSGGRDYERDPFRHQPINCGVVDGGNGSSEARQDLRGIGE